MPASFDDFGAIDVATDDTSIHARIGGHGPPVLLLHGFPETLMMWRDVAPLLADRFSVVCADLRGYGASGCPASSPGHATYSKRAMAKDMTLLMRRLGHDRFAVAGHDRGGRVAYRMALDHPGQVARLAVLDILPTGEVWDRADARLALAYWPWVLLAQPEPLPERLLTAAATAVVDDALGGWGSDPSTFPPAIRSVYAAMLADPAHAHAICEEYRAAATVDRRHDAADHADGRRIACPLLALWGAGGALDNWYSDAGGPLGIWRNWADDVRGRAVDGGHFFPEQQPEVTARLLTAFLGAAAAT